MMKKQIIKMEKVWKIYKMGEVEVNALRGVDVEIIPGEFVSITGASGSGKSTMMNLVGCLDMPSKGSIFLDGRDISRLSESDLAQVRAKKIGFIFQQFNLIPNLTVKENLKMGAELIKEKNEIEKRINEIYKKFPVLKERSNKLAFSLSGGERQMLALGRALMMKPDLLMLDEPSLGLAPKLQKDLFATLKKLRDDFGIAILVVEQNAKKAIELADRTYLLEDGKIALEGGKAILKHKKIKNVYLGGRY